MPKQRIVWNRHNIVGVLSAKVGLSYYSRINTVTMQIGCQMFYSMLFRQTGCIKNIYRQGRRLTRTLKCAWSWSGGDAAEDRSTMVLGTPVRCSSGRRLTKVGIGKTSRRTPVIEQALTQPVISLIVVACWQSDYTTAT